MAMTSCLAAILLCACLAPTLSKPAWADSLIDALTHAYAFNPQLAAAHARLRGIDEQVPQALAGWRPTVTINGSAGYQSFSTGTSRLLPNEFGYVQKNYGGNVQLKQPLFNYGTNADIARAEESVRAGRADLLGTEQSVLMAAATAYADVARGRALVALDRDIENLLRKRLDETKIRVQAGQLTQTDIQQTANRVAAASTTRIADEGNLGAAYARFRDAVGRPVQGNVQLDPPPLVLPADQQQAVQHAQANSPTVLASLFRANAARHAIIVARAAGLPTVSLNASAGADQGQSFPTVATNQASVTVNLTVPVYQGGAPSSQLRQAKQTAEESEHTVAASRQDAERDAASAFAIWRASRDQLVHVTEQVKLAQLAYDGVRKEADLGATSTFEVLGQLQDLFNARVSELQAHYNLATDEYQLLVAVGQFTGAALKLPVTLYDPQKHYDEVRNKWWLAAP